MDFNLRRGVSISFIIAGVVAMIGTSQYIGIALFVIAAIWWYLFLYSKSPVKKYWWAIPDKIMFLVSEELGYKPTVSKENISVWVDLTSYSGIMVNRIVLKIRQKESIPSFEWNSHKVMTREHKFLNFKRPGWLSVGEYESELIAYTPEGYSKSRKFTLEVV